MSNYTKFPPSNNTQSGNRSVLCIRDRRDDRDGITDHEVCDIPLKSNFVDPKVRKVHNTRHDLGQYDLREMFNCKYIHNAVV